jgi:uncharacterized protein
MPFDILERFFVRANSFLIEWPEETLKIIWHGGEPLTLGPQYFYKALELKQTLCKDNGSRISFDMQSNLTLFSREYADVLKKMGINNFGTSFELLPGVRGSGGKKGSDIYNQQFIQALSLLEDEGFSWGIIYVVTKLSLKRPLELFRTLTNFVPSASVMFNPVTFYKDKPDQVAITPEEFVDFLGEIFTEWWRKRNRYPGVDPFKSLADNLIEGSESLICIDSGRCADTHLSVSPDGMVWQCGRSSDWGLMSYGSIVDFSLSDIMNHPQKEMLRKRPLILRDGECSGCRFWGICHGGCPLDALAETGSVMHKSPWCWTKKGFIEKYFEPITGITYQSSIGQTPKSDIVRGEAITIPEANPWSRIFPAKTRSKEEFPWIGPINCMDDVLMVSGILQQIIEENPSQKFNLVNKASYREILQGHQAIAEIGLPPQATAPIRLDYCNNAVRPSSHRRAYQIIAERLGLKTPAKETLFVPWKFEDDPFLMEFIPWKERNILICPYSESPRKQMNIRKWEKLAHKLIEDGFGVMQIANMRNGHVRGVYSIHGLIHLRQMISFIRHFDLIITSHNLFMHVAQLHEIPAVVLWGPSDYQFYGYQDHYHLQSGRVCGKVEGCIGFGTSDQPASPCPMADSHCMNLFEADTIYNAAREIAHNVTSQRK